VVRRVGCPDEPLGALGYSVEIAETPPNSPAAVTFRSTDDDRSITITMTPGMPLVPANHNRVPITILEQTDELIRGETNSNNGWRFEPTAERSADDGPPPPSSSRGSCTPSTSIDTDHWARALGITGSDYGANPPNGPRITQMRGANGVRKLARIRRPAFEGAPRRDIRTRYSDVVSGWTDGSTRSRR